MLKLTQTIYSVSYPSNFDRNSDGLHEHRTRPAILTRINKLVAKEFPEMANHRIVFDEYNRLVIWTRFGNIFYRPELRKLIRRSYAVNMTQAEINLVVSHIVEILNGVNTLDPKYIN